MRRIEHSQRMMWERFIGAFAMGRVIAHQWTGIRFWPTGPDSEASVQCDCPMYALGYEQDPDQVMGDHHDPVVSFAYWWDRIVDDAAEQWIADQAPSWRDLNQDIETWEELTQREQLSVFVREGVIRMCLEELKERGFAPLDYTTEELSRDCERIEAGIEAIL